MLRDYLYSCHEKNKRRRVRKCCATMGSRHHQKYKDVKQISQYKAGLRISCRIELLIKEWHGQIIDGLVFLHETEYPKHE